MSRERLVATNTNPCPQGTGIGKDFSPCHPRRKLMETSSLQAALAHTRSALVIDDSSVERMLAGAVLERLGFSVSCTDSAEQALALLAQRGFDLVVCDIALP